MSIRMWFQLREDVDAASTQGLRDVVENEATVDSTEFALRLAIHHEPEPDPEPAENGDLLVTLASSIDEYRINVIVPIECGLRFLDEGCGRVPVLPSAVEDLYPGETSVVRWAVANRTIRPGDFAVVDVAVTFASGVPEIPIRGVVSGGSGEELAEQISVRIS